jgi:hypothetical protein
MTPTAFLTAVSAATAGERIVYHTGFLCEDRETDPGFAAVADAAWLLGAPRGFRIGGQRESINASGYGAASLVQTRHEALIYDYALCMKRPISAMERAGLVKQMATTERRVRADLDKKLAAKKAA